MAGWTLVCAMIDLFDTHRHGIFKRLALAGFPWQREYETALLVAVLSG